MTKSKNNVSLFNLTGEQAYQIYRALSVLAGKENKQKIFSGACFCTRCKLFKSVDNFYEKHAYCKDCLHLQKKNDYEKRRQNQIICECGSVFKKVSLLKHNQTAKHQKFLLKKEMEITTK